MYEVDEKVRHEEFDSMDKKNIVKALMSNELVVDRLLDFITIGTNYSWGSESLTFSLGKPCGFGSGSYSKLLKLGSTAASTGKISRPFTGNSASMSRPQTGVINSKYKLNRF